MIYLRQLNNRFLNKFTSINDKHMIKKVYNNARPMIKITNNKITNKYKLDMRFIRIYTHEMKNKSTIEKYEYIIKKFNYQNY